MFFYNRHRHCVMLLHRMYTVIHIFHFLRSQPFAPRANRFIRLYRMRSEERRVGKECRSRWSPDQLKKKDKKKAVESNICKHTVTEHDHLHKSHKCSVSTY